MLERDSETICFGIKSSVCGQVSCKAVDASARDLGHAGILRLRQAQTQLLGLTGANHTELRPNGFRA